MFRDDFLLPKSGRSRGCKITIIIDAALSVWVIKETQILPKFRLYLDSHLGRPKFVEYSRVKEWRVTLGVPLSVSTVSSFVPV